MADAAAGLADYMKDVDFKEPALPIYSDYTAKPYEGDQGELVRARRSRTSCAGNSSLKVS